MIRLPRYTAVVRETLTLGVLIATLGLPCRGQQPGLEPALPQSHFVDAVGVTGHFDRKDGVYGWSGQDAHGKELAQLLIDLGVQHYRTKAVTDPEFQKLVLDIRRARNGSGPKAELIVDLRRESSLPLPANVPHRVGGVNHTRVLLQGDDATAGIHELLQSLNDHLAPALFALEGPNEYDTSHHPADSHWDQTLAAFMRSVDREKARQPNLRTLPLVAPSMGNPKHAQTAESAVFYKNGGVSYQYANAHEYPRGEVPSNQLMLGTTTSQTVAGPVPIFQTETGYSNAVGGSGQPGVTEAVAAKYAPRLIAELMRTQVAPEYKSIAPGVRYMNFYELADERIASGDSEAGFGLIGLKTDAGGKVILAPKPVYFAVQRLLHNLEDRGTKHEPLRLNVSTAKAPDALHRLLLQKEDGSYSLLLWLEIPATDGPSDIRTPFTLTLPDSATVSQLPTYAPTSDSRGLMNRSAGQTYEGTLADELLIVSIPGKR